MTTGDVKQAAAFLEEAKGSPELSPSLPRSSQSVPADLSVSSVPFLTSVFFQKNVFPQRNSTLTLKPSCLSQSPLPSWSTEPTHHLVFCSFWAPLAHHNSSPSLSPFPLQFSNYRSFPQPQLLESVTLTLSVPPPSM